MKINKIKISGFKSIADIELNDLTPYSVFAGANGAGKSNFFDALNFISTVVTLGATQALRQFNGYENVHCFKHRGNKKKIFSSEISVEYEDFHFFYDLKIYNMDGQPTLEEKNWVDKNEYIWQRNKKGEIYPPFWGDGGYYSRLPNDISYLRMQPDSPVFRYINNIRVYRFDPLGAKEPDSSSADTTELNSHGHNIATMLSVLEKDDEIREQIIEWMELLVPSLETISTERSRLDARTMIRFKEAGIKANFPAHLISDGTIYALCIMVAVLGRSKQAGMTLIEEPERGIHPKAIAELINLMRENANPNHAIFVTTHSESVVRYSKPEELWLVNKIDGKTEFKNAAKEFSDLGDLNLDKAWLMNMFDGGLPW
ncbi:MAG: ATP-binding protein [Methylococcaceae bacterium]